ncbi:hypothetical protein KIN20_013831 [Parelaphostrongylus tenuis]|uniref:Uncharacterized protein n=1 Tax=Parelaphostrongylus tenuis TaxID=148309 RepID=A0AAD5MWN9_PARTN|nr:hypothetical protein KIN20_013831 [Parelaphostrongylus tenuis]
MDTTVRRDTLKVTVTEAVAGIRRKFQLYATHHTLRDAVQQLLNCSTDDSALTVVALPVLAIDKMTSELRKLLDPAAATKFVEQVVDFVQSVRKVQERQHSSNGTSEAHVPKEGR